MSSDIINNEVIWNKRWERFIGSLDVMIKSLDKDVEIEKGVLDPRQPPSDLGYQFQQSLNYLERKGYEKKLKTNVATLLVRLKIFSDTLFNFFHDGFYDSGVVPHLNERNPLYSNLLYKNEDKTFFEASKLSVDEILGMLVQHATDDFVRIQSLYHLNYGDRGDIEQRKNMLLASLLMRRSIDLFTESTLNGPYYDQLVAVAYPNNRLEVRVVPYCETLFVGFPITAFFDDSKKAEAILSNDYILLSHEAGHIAFRAGRLPLPDEEAVTVSQRERTVRHILMTKASTLQHQFSVDWVEELFCDLYSCFVEGPVFAVGFQLILLSNPPEDFTTPHYPTPALRPLMHARMLKAMVNHDSIDWPDWVTQAADKLEERWKESVKYNWQVWLSEEDNDANDVLEKRFDLSHGQETGAAILESVDALVQLVLNEMVAWEFTSKTDHWADTFENAEAVSQISSTKVVEKLYRQFCNEAALTVVDIQAEMKKVAKEGSNQEEAIKAYASTMVLDEVAAVEDAEDLIFYLLESWDDHGPDGGNPRPPKTMGQTD